MNNTSLLVSVVICTYNRAKLLHTCLQSLNNQTADKRLYEVIVVDNNSDDNTQQKTKSFIKNRHSFRLVSEKNLGRSQARNRGWKEAKGQYVAYIDDDAIANPDWVGQIVQFIKNHPEVSVFGGPYDRFSHKPFPDWLPENYFALNLGNNTKMLNLKNEWISGSNMIFKKLLFEKYGGFNTDFGGKGDKIIYGEETELLLRFKNHREPVYYVPAIRMKHLVAERKFNLWWVLKNDFWHGLSSSLVKKQKCSFITDTINFLLALLLIPVYLADMKRGVLKNRLFYGLSNIFLSLGQMAGSIYNEIGLITVYFLIPAFFTSIFIFLFHTSFFINQYVLFYRGLLLLVLTICITCIISALFHYYLFKVRLESFVAAIIMSVSINLSFFVIFPVTFDRSITMYLLSTLNEKSINQTCGGLSENALEQYFITEYVKDNFAIRRRINEQSIINILKDKNNCVQLTQTGRRFIDFSKLVKKIYSVQ